MKGVILAGGTGTRLYPLTKVTNKHLLPVGKEPMVFNPVRQIVSAGITDILVVTGKDHMGEIVRLLGSGIDFNCNFTYRVQEKAGGIADALALAKGFANYEPVVVILGDNILTHSIKKHVDAFRKQPSGAKVLLKRVGDPEKFGVAALDELKKMIIKIEEKPENPESDYAVIGVYMYDYRVFDVIQTIQPSERGELEITSVNNWYVSHNAMTYDLVDGEWTDAGTFESLLYANQMLFATNNIIRKEGEQ
jgi:glucose-1-phosphate thymidylyltransferase